MDDVLVETRGLRKSYRQGHAPAEVLRGVDLRVRRGEFVVVMGPSGCGKSTLLHLLGALDRPTSGEVLIDGQALSGLGESRLVALRRDRIGFVFQRFNLVTSLSARANLALSLRIRPNGKELRGRIDEVLARVGLDGKSHLRPGQLSIGEQQRVAVARAVLHRPDLLLADEPTGNLDSDNAQAVLDLLAELNRAGQTLVMVTHSAEAAQRGTRVARMRDGRLA